MEPEIDPALSIELLVFRVDFLEFDGVKIALCRESIPGTANATAFSGLQ